MPLPSLIKVILESEENLQAGYPNSRGWRQGDFDYCWNHMRTCVLNIWKDKGRVKERRHLLAEAIHTLAAAWSPVCRLSPLNSHHPHQDHRLGGKFKQFHNEGKKGSPQKNDISIFSFHFHFWLHNQKQNKTYWERLRPHHRKFSSVWTRFQHLYRKVAGIGWVDRLSQARPIPDHLTVIIH